MSTGNTKINVALISPNENAYSETFIQHHKKLLNANIFYLYNEALPRLSEDKELFVKYTLFNKLRRRINKTFFPQFLNFHERTILKYFRKHRIEVVLAEFGMTGVAMSGICRKLNIPLIVHFHGVDAYVTDILIENEKKYKSLFQQASFIIAVSTDMYNKLHGLGCPKAKLVLNPYGPSDIFFLSKPAYTSQCFIAVGRFVEKKSPESIIAAFEKVLKKYPDAFLKMVGDGPLLQQCKKLAEDLKLKNNIEFSGVQSPEKILALYQQSIAFVQHSVTAKDGDSEGTPVAVLEASASALPVIATSHAGINDVVIEGLTGFLTDEHDIEGMANSMSRILQNPALASSLGQEGRRRIKNHFSLNKHISVLNDVIQKSLIA